MSINVSYTFLAAAKIINSKINLELKQKFNLPLNISDKGQDKASDEKVFLYKGKW